MLFAADLLVGSVAVPWSELGTPGSLGQRLLFDFRLPKALAALLAGGGLSLAGLLMQTIFRNPLAGPYVLGVSSGAGLGVALFLLGGTGLGLGLARDLGVALAAWIGAGAILLVVMAVSARIRDMMAVLILGMMFGSAAGAFINVLQYFSNEAALKGFVVWSMGSLGGLSHGQLWVLGLCTISGIGLALSAVKPLNLLLLGEQYAQTMGVRLTRTRGIVFLATSLLAGSATAFCGPIAFVGIAVPHIARMLFRTANHRVLLPAVLLTGSCLMLLCDLVSQLPGFDLVLPINTVTALFGIPVVVLVVWNNKRSR